MAGCSWISASSIHQYGTVKCNNFNAKFIVALAYAVRVFPTFY